MGVGGGVYRPPFIMAQVQNIIKKTSGSTGEDLDIINTATDDTSVAGIYRNINILCGNNNPAAGTTLYTLDSSETEGWRITPKERYFYTWN